ncbi:hypothetical protein RFI_17068 [Reticulomyxa filosa]|uniref:Dolichol kinase n=1 Tax=Reticulomyxa filosa TaxID=46433 RepID=X6N1J4_RETFI|nr:hypothetical protein RFI_17068 [Reticulomyxa filosa]|eukprot:ETO20150.1 hypothetical protein RFI_17068 [Reticulomyxa filosa]
MYIFVYVCVFMCQCVVFLILGDMSAAIFGISFGKVKIGKKSLEGTLAMFSVCFVVGINMFWNIHMREYPVILASLVAALTELIEPWGINDNLTIPFFSCLALQFGFHRIATCDRNWDVWSLLDPSVVENLVSH